MRSVLNDDAYASGTSLVLAALLGTALYLAGAERWIGVVVIGATIAIAVIFVRLQDRLPRIFNLLFVLAGAVNAGAYVFNLWERISVYDEAVHAYTTFALAAAFGYLLFHRTSVNSKSHPWRFVAAVALFGFGIGLLWEGFEWVTGLIGDALDTLIDLFADTVGAIAAGLFCVWTASRARKERATTKARESEVRLTSLTVPRTPQAPIERE